MRSNHRLERRAARALLLGDRPENYRSPESRKELEERYASGERTFPNTDLSGADLSGIKRDGAAFERHSWFFDSSFLGASFYGCELAEGDELPSWEW